MFAMYASVQNFSLFFFFQYLEYSTCFIPSMISSGIIDISVIYKDIFYMQLNSI